VFELNRIKCGDKSVIFLIFIVLSCAICIFISIFYAFQSDSFEKIKTIKLEKIQDSFEKNIQKHLKEHYEQKIQRYVTTSIVQAIATGDRNALQRLTQEQFLKDTNQDSYLKALHFHKSDGTSFLRLHEPAHYGDAIAKQRPNIAAVHQNKQTIYGFEHGDANFLYRIVTPLFLQEKYVGSVEMGVSPQKVLDLVTHFNNIDGIIVLSEGGKTKIYSKIADDALQNAYDLNAENKTVLHVGGERYHVYKFPITDSQNHVIGEFVFFNQMTRYYDEFDEAMLQMFVASIVLFVLLFILIGYLVTKHGARLNALNSRVKKILDLQSDIVLVTKGQEIVEVNRRFLEVFGYESLEAFKKHYDCICDLFIEQEGYMGKVTEGLLWTDYLFKHADKENLAKIDCNKDERIFKLHIGTIDATESVVSLSDVTQLKKLNASLQKQVDKKVSELQEKEELLNRQAKMAALGEMIGAIAHQWRQPLNVLSINIQNLDDDYAEGLIDEAFIQRYVKKQIELIAFMSKTVDDFRNFFNSNKNKTKFSVSIIARSVVRLLQAQMNAHAIKVEIIGEDFEIEGYQNELKQVFLNLISNAKDAIITQKKEGLIRIVLDKNEQSVRICDNGGGVDESIIGKLFDPYFTTKPKDKGTGIGLYISRTVIENNMQGAMRLYNAEGGLCVEMRFA
jgi:signal transduction histidine kinase